jgi:hypothetical protein
MKHNSKKLEIEKSSCFEIISYITEQDAGIRGVPFRLIQDFKETALSQCIAYRKEYASHHSAKKVFKESDMKGFRTNERMNYAVDLYLMLKISLYEYDEGIDYFWKNSAERNKEIKLYRLLVYFLDSNDKRLNELWIREYEKAVASDIKPREVLRESYDQRIAEKNIY